VVLLGKLAWELPKPHLLFLDLDLTTAVFN